jgi:hypothetical protein
MDRTTSTTIVPIYPQASVINIAIITTRYKLSVSYISTVTPTKPKRCPTDAISTSNTGDVSIAHGTSITRSEPVGETGTEWACSAAIGHVTATAKNVLCRQTTMMKRGVSD